MVLECPTYAAGLPGDRGRPDLLRPGSGRVDRGGVHLPGAQGAGGAPVLAGQLRGGVPAGQAIAIMMEAHWRSAVHPDRAEGIGAFTEGREPIFADPDH